MNACYVQSSQEYYYTTSGFIHSAVDNGDGTTTYYLLSSASGIFHYYQVQGEVLSMKQQGVFEFVFRNGSRYLGEYVGSYDAFDVAVFALTTADVLPLPTLGSSDDLLVGEAVYAIGTPAFDVSLINTYVGGVVSGLHRRQYVYFNNTSYALADYSVFQFDAPINGGMEGGAVVNANGEIVGMLSYKYVDDTSDVTFESIAMAVGMDDISRVIDQIIATGTYARPTIGITIMDVALLSSQDRLANGIYASLYEGVLVSTVSSGTAAARANMVAGEVVVAFNGQQVTNIASLASYLVRTIAGESITLTTVNSLGITKNYTVQL
jgi:S1-C subfamily serine protease